MFNWKLKATNAIYLEDANGQEGRPFKSRFLQAGLVKYDFGVCLLKKETIDKFINTFVGCPVIIDHKDDIAEDDSVGTINTIWFSAEDGWYWCSGILTDPKAIELIENGYNVSCQYRITEYSENTEGKLHNANPYDKEILDGVFEHLAIVENPRYEDAFIAVNAYIAKNDTVDANCMKHNQIDFNPNVTINKASNKYQKVYDYIRNTEGEPMDNETKTIFSQLMDALKARNEAEDEKEKEKAKEKQEETAANEDTDKRKLIDEVGGILKGKVDEEIWRTIIGKLEKVAYDKSEAGTADNGKSAKNEDTESKKDDELKKDKEAQNKCTNEDDTNYEKLYKELKDKVDKDAENQKAKNSLDDVVNKLYSSLTKEPEPNYISPQKGIELGEQIYGR